MLEDHRHGYYGTLPVFTFIAHFDFVSGLVPDWIEAGSDAPMHTHNHESPELIYITKGSMSAEINGDRKTVREGDLMIMSPYDLHSADFIDKTRTLEYCCHFIRAHNPLPAAATTPRKKLKSSTRFQTLPDSYKRFYRQRDR